MEQTHDRDPREALLQGRRSLPDHRHAALRPEVLGERVPAAGLREEPQRPARLQPRGHRPHLPHQEAPLPGRVHHRRRAQGARRRPRRRSSTPRPRRHARAAPSRSKKPADRRRRPSSRPCTSSLFGESRPESPEASSERRRRRRSALPRPLRRGARHVGHRQRGPRAHRRPSRRRPRAQPPRRRAPRGRDRVRLDALAPRSDRHLTCRGFRSGRGVAQPGSALA